MCYNKKHFLLSPLAEGLVTNLIKQLASIATREAEQEIRLVIGVDEEVRKLHNLRQ